MHSIEFGLIRLVRLSLIGAEIELAQKSRVQFGSNAELSRLNPQIPSIRLTMPGLKQGRFSSRRDFPHIRRSRFCTLSSQYACSALILDQTEIESSLSPH